MRYTLPPPTDEQQKIVECIREGHSAAVHAVAGSGKTTSILHVARACPDLSILFLTYSASLKEDTRLKLQKLSDIANVEAHSFHSFACSYYHRDSFDNLRIALGVDVPFRDFSYHLLVVDEVQDMTPCIYEFLCKVIRDVSKVARTTQYIFLGDTAQCIYKYRDSDPRYLSMCGDLLNVPMKHLVLSRSFRLTKQMAGFINHVLRGKDRWQEIRAERDVPESVVYLKIDSPFSIGGVVEYIRGVVRTNKIRPEDIYIIAPTVEGKDSNPCVKLQMRLKSEASSIWPNEYCNVHVKTHGDDSSPNANVLKNKMCFMNFHQSKGREARVTVVFNIDQSYFKYYDDSGDRHLTEALLVSMTRAKDKLIVVESANHGPLEFMDESRLEEFARVYDLRTMASRKRKESSPPRHDREKTVSQWCRHVMEETLEQCLKFFDTELLEPPGDTIRIEDVVTIVPGTLYESVHDLNGSAVTLHARAVHKGKRPAVQEVISEALEEWTRGNKYTHRKSQIPPTKRSWISQDVLDRLAGRLLDHVSDMNVSFEHELPGSHRIAPSVVDVLDREKKILWEVKNTTRIRPTHLLQTALYAFLSMENGMEGYDYRILNVKTGEIHRVVSTHERLLSMVKLLMAPRPETPPSDDEFIRMTSRQRQGT